MGKVSLKKRENEKSMVSVSLHLKQSPKNKAAEITTLNNRIIGALLTLNHVSVYSFQVQGNTMFQQKVDFTTQVPQVAFQFVVHLHRFCNNTLRTNLRSYADIRSNKNTQRSIYYYIIRRHFNASTAYIQASLNKVC